MTDEKWHGTFGGYTNHACRCDECRRANAEQAFDYRRRNPRWRAYYREYMRRYRAKAKEARS